ncbi:hypothetical protein BD410DRAFT_806435 [Rickenella mellea]|uniref:Uncharacterized protein n=1 Tax=Rickenella mellea TaxID=50990 RepID=A0A4Y7PU57_9AGAM|nr:hypothetical protein BD410DRAFT_806435 [Rickenella mellea]
MPSSPSPIIKAEKLEDVISGPMYPTSPPPPEPFPTAPIMLAPILYVVFETRHEYLGPSEHPDSSFVLHRHSQMYMHYDVERSDALDRIYAHMGLPPKLRQLSWRLDSERETTRHRLRSPSDVEKAFVAYRKRETSKRGGNQTVLHIYDTTPTPEAILAKMARKEKKLKRDIDKQKRLAKVHARDREHVSRAPFTACARGDNVEVARTVARTRGAARKMQVVKYQPLIATRDAEQ